MAQQSNINRSDLIQRFGSQPSEAAETKHELVEGKFFELAEFLNDTLPDGRAKSLAMTDLESSAMWAAKAMNYA